MEIVEAVRQLLPAMAAAAAEHDCAGTVPAASIRALATAGALLAPMPVTFGGGGVGTEPGGAETVRAMLLALGRGNLAVARLWEAHVNALRLVVRFGAPAAIEAAAADARAGELFGLWVTDSGSTPLRAADGVLVGAKGPCSGAGFCRRALVTADTPAGTRMAVVALTGSEPVVPIAGLQGMRAAANGVVTLDGVAVRDWIGAAGDYLREPDFSCGAWRSSAAAAGGLDALVTEVAAALRRSGRDTAPLQQERFGRLLVAQETARLHVARMADAAEREGDVVAVGLGRIAVESACLDAIRLVQRSLGLQAFVAPAPVERILRDLATYLRQPAADAVLLEAAAYHLARS